MLRIDIQAAPKVATLRCTGRIVLGLEAETLRCMAETRTEPCVILDLRQVHAMDATGLGLLVELHCRARRRGQSLVIANASRCVRRLITLVNLRSVLEMTGSGDDHSWRDYEDQSRFGRDSLTA